MERMTEAHPPGFFNCRRIRWRRKQLIEPARVWPDGPLRPSPMITEKPSSLLCICATLSFSAALPAVALAADPGALAAGREPPTSWIDKDTGHRVVRLTREANSASFYFNDNGYTPDGKEMVYTTPEGISVLNLATLETRQVVPGPVRAIVVGRKTPTIFYARSEERPLYSELWCANVETGAARKLADLPRRGGIATVNSDETLGGGTYIEGDASAGGNRSEE